MFFACISDRYRQRAAVIASQAVMTLVGMVMTGYAPTSGGRYAGMHAVITSGRFFEELTSFSGVFFVVSGSSGAIPGILAYVSKLRKE